MVIANLSSIFMSLRSPSLALLMQSVRTFTVNTSISTQVQLLSLTNTLSRLVVGATADFLAPVPISFNRSAQDADAEPRDTSISDTRYELDGAPGLDDAPAKSNTGVYYAFPRTHYISRIAFLLGGCLLLLTVFTLFLVINSNAPNAESMSLLRCVIDQSPACAAAKPIPTIKQCWCGHIVRNWFHNHVGILSLLLASSSLTIHSANRPGILTAIWGPANLGRNFGIFSYAPFVGTSVFSYLYAFLVDRHSSTSAEPVVEPNEPGSGTTCIGPQCWQTTFSVCIGSLALACCVSGALWKRWQGRV